MCPNHKIGEMSFNIMPRHSSSVLQWKGCPVWRAVYTAKDTKRQVKGTEMQTDMQSLHEHIQTAEKCISSVHCKYIAWHYIPSTLRNWDEI